MTALPSSSHAVPRARRGARWLALYLFGLSITTFLVGVWGQAVTGDEQVLGAGIRAGLASELVAERVESWLASSIETDDGALEEIISRIVHSPEAEIAIGSLVDGIVGASLAEPGGTPTVDAQETLAPIGRLVAGELAQAGYPVEPAQVTSVLTGLEPMVLGASTEVAETAAAAREVLTVAAVAAAVMAVVSGALAVRLAEDRLAMGRTLLLRVAVGAMTFVLFARIGAWALDPSGGASPVAAAGAAVLRSHTPLLVGIMVGGAIAGTGLGVYAARRRLLEEGDRPVEPRELDDEPTTELVLADA